MRRTEERNSLVESDNCDQLKSISISRAAIRTMSTTMKPRRTRRRRKSQIAAGEQHEGDADRHALVGHVGVEHDARQREIHHAADDQQRQDQRMKAQHVMADRPDDAGGHDRDQREGGDVGIIGDDIHQPVDLAALLPIGVGNQAASSGWHRAAAPRRGTAGRWRRNRRCGRARVRAATPTAARSRTTACRCRKCRAPRDGRKTARRRKRSTARSGSARRARAARSSRPAPTARRRCRTCSSSSRRGRRNCRAAETRTAATPTSGRSARG